MEQTNSNDIDSPVKPQKTSRAAIASLVLGIIGFFVPFITAISGLILGIGGLRKVRKSQGRLKGRGLAIAGTVVSGVSIVSWCVPTLLFLGYIFYMNLTIPEFEQTGGYRISCEVANGRRLDDVTINEICEIFKKRVDPADNLGVLVHGKENRQIEICIPVCDRTLDISKPEDIIRMLKGTGVLEFRILPTSADEKNTEAELKARMDELKEKGPKAASDDKFVWCEIMDIDSFPKSFLSIGAPAIAQYGNKLYVLCSNQVHNNEVLLHGGDNKWKLQKVYSDYDQQGRPAIGFMFDDIAADLFYKITSDNQERPLCILLDDQALSAPIINSPIRSRGIIAGNFTDAEVSEMVNKLNAGVLPAPVRVIEESVNWTSPQ